MFEAVNVDHHRKRTHVRLLPPAPFSQHEAERIPRVRYVTPQLRTHFTDKGANATSRVNVHAQRHDVGEHADQLALCVAAARRRHTARDICLTRHLIQVQQHRRCDRGHRSGIALPPIGLQHIPLLSGDKSAGVRRNLRTTGQTLARLRQSRHLVQTIKTLRPILRMLRQAGTFIYVGVYCCHPRAFGAWRGGHPIVEARNLLQKNLVAVAVNSNVVACDKPHGFPWAERKEREAIHRTAFQVKRLQRQSSHGLASSTPRIGRMRQIAPFQSDRPARHDFLAHALRCLDQA